MEEFWTKLPDLPEAAHLAITDIPEASQSATDPKWDPMARARKLEKEYYLSRQIVIASKYKAKEEWWELNAQNTQKLAGT
ncbi:hypothetical protein PtB15_5B654 [Puccinia triticina]|nr:hypothetical protein PtB15_5B654 [Puccinia triticina]